MPEQGTSWVFLYIEPPPLYGESIGNYAPKVLLLSPWGSGFSLYRIYFPHA